MAKPSPPPTFVLKRAAQLRALASPERWKVVQALSVHGPCSVRELGEHLGRVPESLYYHVERLQKLGLVTRTGERPGRRRREALYDLVGPIEIDAEQRSPAFLGALDGLYAAGLRAAARSLSRSLEGERKRAGPRQRQGLVQYTARLSPRKQRELRARLEALIDFVIENDDPSQPEATLLTIAYGAEPVDRESRPRDRD